MNKIPKLEIKQIYWTPRGLDLYDDDSDQYHDFICPDNLKKVNAFYNKYKDNMGLFIKDFPEFKTYWEHREKSLSLCCIQEYLYIELFKDFKDWLHDLLYKVE